MQEDSKLDGASAALQHLYTQLSKILPKGETARLTQYQAKIAGTTDHHDLHRCYRCVEWAVELSAEGHDSESGSLITKLKKVLKEAHSASWATEFGLFVSHHPIMDLEISWINDTIEVAESVAEKSGWDKIPLEKLLDDLVAMEPRS